MSDTEVEIVTELCKPLLDGRYYALKMRVD